MERDYLPPIRDVPEEFETLKLDQIEVKWNTVQQIH